MDNQKSHNIFAEAIAQEFISELTGDKVEYLSGKVPEEKFIVGQLSPMSDNPQIMTSKTIINAIGLNFNIAKRYLPDCELIIHLCGNM